MGRCSYSVPVQYIVFVISVICKGQCEKTCTVGPIDNCIEINSSIEIACRSSCSSGRIYWTLNGSRIDDRLSETINSTYTVLSLRNFSHSSATIECRSSSTGIILGGTTIRTYTKPSNISCLLLFVDKEGGFPNQFTCSWYHNMTSSMKVNYTVITKCASCSQSENCASTTTSCTTSGLHVPSLLKNISVTVSARTAAWDVVSEPYMVDPYQLLQIPAPKIRVTALSNGLLVEWEHVSGYDGHNIHCQVGYKETFSGMDLEHTLNVSLNRTVQRGQVTIEEVESCSNYTVAARCALDDAPWSKWSQNKTVLSQLNNRTVKFNLWRKIKEPNGAGVREVLVMWRTIPPLCKGDFDYRVGQIRESDFTRHTGYTLFKFNRATFCGPSTCHINVDEEAHVIKLSVHHDGAQLGQETVYIPASGESVPQVSLIQTSVHDGDIEVRWEAPEQPVRGYMIDWTCDGFKYFWKEIKETNTTLTELQDLTRYNITVTPLFDDKTGRGTQALNCSRTRAPGAISIDNVRPEDRSARVMWSAADLQEQCSTAAARHTVFYSDSQSQLNVTVDGEKKEALLTGLNPATKYSVRVVAIACSGNSSSLDRHFETRRFDPNLTLVLGVCGGLGIFLVLFLGLCCTIQWKKFMEKMVPNPGLSSLAVWSSQNYQKIHPFTNPSESLTICERVYPCELYPSKSGSQPLVTDDSDTAEAASDQTRPLSSGFSESNASESGVSDVEEEMSESGLDPADSPHAPGSSQEEKPASSPEETPEPRAPGSGPVHPYRSQTSEDHPASICPAKQGAETDPGANEECDHTDKTAYVTVDMFEQEQGRGREGDLITMNKSRTMDAPISY